MRASLRHFNPDPLRAARLGAGLSLAELAVRARVAVSTLSLAERHGLVSPATAGRLAGALGLPAEALWGLQATTTEAHHHP